MGCDAASRGGAPIVRIELPTPFPVGNVNVYLIEDRPLTLVDAGPNSAEALTALTAGLAARGRGLEEIELLLLTHQHSDHVGLAGEVVTRSGATVAAIEPLARFLGDHERSMQVEEEYQGAVMELHGVPREPARRALAAAQAKRGPAHSVHVARPLAAGDVVELESRRLRVSSRSGHSPTDTIFVDEEARVALVGDHLIVHISSNPVVHSPLDGSRDPRHRTPALRNYLDSLGRTAALDLDLLHPGHGRDVADHRRLIAERLELHAGRKRRIHTELRDGPRSAHQVALQLWGDVAVEQAFLTACEVLGHLDLLEADGVVVQRERDGVVEYAAA